MAYSLSKHIFNTKIQTYKLRLDTRNIEIKIQELLGMELYACEQNSDLKFWIVKC